MSRVCGGAASAVVIGGALVGGGLATLVTASAHHFNAPATTPNTTGTASGGGFVVGSAVLNDTASLASDVSADRVVKFQLWGPDNPTCNPSGAAAVFQQNVHAVQGPGTVKTTGGYTGISPEAAEMVGTYQWTAQIVAPGGGVEDASSCGSEPVLLVAGTDLVSTTPSTAGAVGTVIHDAATVSGTAQSPSGSVIFILFPPSNSSCSPDGTAPVLTSAPVHLTSVNPGVSNATGPDYRTSVVGTYHWMAAFSGDSTYPAGKSKCADEAVVVTQAKPTIRTTPSGGGTSPTTIHDSAAISGGAAPYTGAVTFRLFAPGDSSCTGTHVFISTIALSGSATVDSATFSANTTGTYHWTASYGGDANNAGASSACADEAVVITSAPTPTPGPTPPGAVLGIATPSTGSGASSAAATIGGFLLIGGIGLGLLALMPRNRRRIF